MVPRPNEIMYLCPVWYYQNAFKGQATLNLISIKGNWLDPTFGFAEIHNLAFIALFYTIFALKLRIKKDIERNFQKYIYPIFIILNDWMSNIVYKFKFLQNYHSAEDAFEKLN